MWECVILISFLFLFFLVMNRTYVSISTTINTPIETKTLELSKETFFNTDVIPTIIWSYWDNDHPPELVTNCITSWKRYNPSYDIRLVNNQNLSTYLPHVDILAFPLSNYPQRISDFIRIHILAEYGGIWADASLLMNESLEWVHSLHTSVVLYSIDHIHDEVVYPVVENWFIACSPKNDFIIKWRDEFVSINRFTDGDAYLQDLRERGTNLNTIFCTSYLTMHAAAQFVFQKLGTSSSMTVLDAREGPYKHLRFNTNPLTFEQGIPNLCNDTPERIVKFRGIDREFINNHKDVCACIDKFFN
jgi:Capsular polysaccharide synthesis protein